MENDVARESHVAFVGTCFKVHAGGKQNDAWLVLQFVLPVAAWTSPVAALNACEIELQVAPELSDFDTMSWFGLGQKEVSLWTTPVKLSGGGTAVAYPGGARITSSGT